MTEPLLVEYGTLQILEQVFECLVCVCVGGGYISVCNCFVPCLEIQGPHPPLV